MQYRVYLDELISGTVDMEAESKEEAERKALQSAEIDWSDDSTTSVCDVVRIDDEGSELE